jgi:hypothetical protein
VNRACCITRVDSQTLDSGRDRTCTYRRQKRHRRIDTTSRSLSNNRHASLLLPPLSNPTPPLDSINIRGIARFFHFFLFFTRRESRRLKIQLKAFIYDQQVLVTAAARY